MKYILLLFAVLNLCSVSAQVTKMPIGGKMLDVIQINTNRGRFEITHPPKRTVSGWMQHEQFRIKSYPVTHGKVLGWAVCAFAGALDGVIEGYEFDGRTSFERKYGASPLSFWGSESWKRAYPDNDPEQRMKPVWRVLGAPDFYHFADDGRKIGYISGAVVIGFSGAQVNKKWWHYAADFAASLAISGVAKSAGMYLIRN